MTDAGLRQRRAIAAAALLAPAPCTPLPAPAAHKYDLASSLRDKS